MHDELRRKLHIGFMDSIPIYNRHRMICSGCSICEAHSMFPNEKDYSKDVDEVLLWLDKGTQNRIIWYYDENYPEFYPVERRVPYMLFYKGEFMPKNAKSVAIVGTRQTDNEGFQYSFKTGVEASINGYCVISGMADGCDQAALSGAVIGGTPSYAVLGCGLSIDYPSYSSKLKDEMIEKGGALISRFSPMCPPLKHNFPNRNLIIAAMGQATIVIQAPKKSGSLITADMSLQLGKDVLVSKAGLGSVWERIGSSELYYEGAPVFDSFSAYFGLNKKLEQCGPDKKNSIRFGNKHYFIMNSI